MMPTTVSDVLLETLRAIPTPAIANALEVLDVRPRNLGFCSSCMRDLFPEMGQMVGFATTAMVRANMASPIPKQADQESYFEHVLSIPAPRIAVIQDVDSKHAGAYWGEVMSNVHVALGCIGTVTQGGVRDIDEVRELGFHLFATDIVVSRASISMIDFGVPVTVADLTVEPGDLLACDKHGVIQIPLDVAHLVPMINDELEAGERKVISYCKGTEATAEGIAGELRAMRESRRRLQLSVARIMSGGR